MLTPSRTSYAFATLLVLLAFGCAAQAQTDVMTIQDPRPVAKALQQLEMLHGWQITYEDPPYVYMGDLVDVTRTVRSDLSGGRTANKVMIPKGGALSFPIPIVPVEPLTQPSTSRPSAAFDAVRNVLDSDASIRGAEMFTVIQGGQLLHVVPTQRKSTSGRVEKVTPLLDIEISVESKERTAAELIDEICRSLSLMTKSTVVVGTVPAKLLMAHPTTLNASQESARSILDRLFDEIDVPLSWQLFYDPTLKWYVLNIHTVVLIEH